MINNPVIKLLDINQDPHQLMAKVWKVAKDKEPSQDIEYMSDEQYDSIMSTDLPTQEYIWTIWLVEGMPRAFWDQFDRCRLAAFWEQSCRILDLSTFSRDENYWTPDSIANSQNARMEYDHCMSIIQDTYNALIKSGIPSEEARGVIPLHVNVRGTCAINLRALRGLIGQRACFVSQGSYWLPVIHGMMKELKNHLPPKTFKTMTRLPCHGKDFCPIESNVTPRITGEDPNPPCPIYIKRFFKGTEFAKPKNWNKIKKTYFDFIRTLGLEEEDEKET